MTLPELYLTVRWPDASQSRAYSPSSIVADYFAPGETLTVADFTARAAASMQAASDRVQARYGFACSRAAATLDELQTRAARYAEQADAQVTIVEVGR
jgi:uncharacterized repeat protein (TIGR04042 family)